MQANRPILIAFDGSENAAHAIAVAGELFGAAGGPADVVHAWEPVTSAAARSAVDALAYDETPEMLERERAAATELAGHGVELAAAAGFQATAHARSGSGPLWATLIDAIEELQPRLVVMGTRGLTGWRGALSGSVSHHVTQHSSVPVLTVPREPAA